MAYTVVESSDLRPAGLLGSSVNFTEEDLAYIVSQFQVELPITMEDFKQKGNINKHTYVLKTGDGRECLLQKVNSDVFTRPYRVMDSMIACIGAQNKSLQESPQFWEPITLIKTRRGGKFLDVSDDNGWCVWRLMERIQNVQCYKSLSELPEDQRDYTAEEVGRGLAIYGDLTSAMPMDLPSPLPGYRHADIYFNQLDSVLAGTRNPIQAEKFLPESDELREATGLHFLVRISPEEAAIRKQRAMPWIDFIQVNRARAMVLHEALQSGRIRRMMIHGDTKIENFLFCGHTGRVRSLVDLDTIVPGTWLADWGDMVRSLVNIAGETETDLDQVQVNREVYEAVAKGFLATTTLTTPQELELMADAVISITLELGTRFLTDYLRGDTYFSIPEEGSAINFVKAMVQLTLAKRLIQERDSTIQMLQKLTANSR